MISGWLVAAETMATSTIAARVEPVLAAWGYNTPSQQAQAKEARYTVLQDPSELANVFDLA